MKTDGFKSRQLLFNRDNDDITQLHRQQKQLVSELKHIQTRRQVSRDDGGIDTGDLYKTERDIQLSSSPHEQSAYTGASANTLLPFDGVDKEFRSYYMSGN